MNQRRIILFPLFFTLGACASSKQLHVSLEKMERDQVSLKMKQAETQRKMEDLSNSVLVLQDRLETLKVAADRHPRALIPLVRTKPKRSQKPKRKAKKNLAKSIFGFGQGGGNLPTLAFTNQDLDEMGSNSSEKGAVGGVGQKTPLDHRDDPAIARAYNEAFKKFEAESYAEAIPMLEAFVRNYPTHVYSDNAVFWIGESFYRMRNFAKAVEQYERVVREFPTGNKVPDALLRSASCYLRLNQFSKAEDAFEKIIATYPQSIAAQKARASLTEISDTGSGQRRM